MEVVTINGVEYVKAAVLAKRFRYTTDYIGQLCRGRKVDAQLVGRTWYVNPLSIEGHKVAKQAKGRSLNTTRADEKEFTYKVKINQSRLDVPPVLKRTTAKSLAALAPSKNFADRITWKPVRYEADEADLLPALEPVGEPVRLTVAPAEAVSVVVNESVAVTNLVPDTLPTVALKGRVKVLGLKEEFETDEDFETGQSIDDITNKNKSFVRPVEPNDTIVQAPAWVPRLAKPRRSKRHKSDSDAESTYAVSITKLPTETLVKARSSLTEARPVLSPLRPARTSDNIDFTPARVRAAQETPRPGSIRGEILVVPSAPRGYSLLFRSLWVVFLLVVAFGLLVFGLERVEVFSVGQSETGWQWRVR